VEHRSLPVPDGLDGARVDAGLAKLLGFSRTRVAEIASAGGILLDGMKVDKSDRLRAAAWLEVSWEPPRTLEVEAVPVPDLDSGIRFYREGLGHELLWRNDAIGQAGLARLLDGFAAREHLDHRHTLGELERGLDRVGEPAPDPGLGDEPVDDDLDRVLLVTRELATLRLPLGEIDRLRLLRSRGDPHAHEPLRREARQQLVVAPLATAHDRGEHLEARALRERLHLVDDLLGRLACDRPPARGAMR
jgi:catechol 2,3-dioxygenase-like lactoylglutathione lyase family enzyme